MRLIVIRSTRHFLSALRSTAWVRLWNFTLEQQVLLYEVCSYLHRNFIFIRCIYSWFFIFVLLWWSPSNTIHYYRTDISCPSIAAFSRLVCRVVLVICVGMVWLILFENLCTIFLCWSPWICELSTLVDGTRFNFFTIWYSLVQFGLNRVVAFFRVRALSVPILRGTPLLYFFTNESYVIDEIFNVILLWNLPLRLGYLQS